MYIAKYKKVKNKKGAKEIFDCIVQTDTGEVILPKYEDYTCAEDYISDGVLSIEPMTAKAYKNEEELNLMTSSTEYLAEEKIDGARGTMHMYPEGVRIFSRNISTKTNWYNEFSDSLPHLRDLEVPSDFNNTVIDGELKILGKDFKYTSATLNSTWSNAIINQIEHGLITLVAFDIIYYKGVYVAKMPLIQRKELLKKVLKVLNSPYVIESYYTVDVADITLTQDLMFDYLNGDLKEVYPNLEKMVSLNYPDKDENLNEVTVKVDKKTWYEYIVWSGGEGLMLKPIKGKYYHKRTREYTKWKKYETWDVYITGYTEPEVLYTGKEIDNPNAKWDYWVDAEDESKTLEKTMTIGTASAKGYLPCTKFWCKNWIGAIQYAVSMTANEFNEARPLINKEKLTVLDLDKRHTSLVVGECSGLDDALRQKISENVDDYELKVIEVGGQELTKTGKIRHPRFIRFRKDKTPQDCTWSAHMNLDDEVDITN